MELADFFNLVGKYGGGVAVAGFIAFGIFYFGSQLRNQGATLGITSLQAALEQNDQDKEDMRAELRDLRKEHAAERATDRAEVQSLRTELAATKRHARAMQQYIVTHYPEDQGFPKL